MSREKDTTNIINKISKIRKSIKIKYDSIRFERENIYDIEMSDSFGILIERTAKPSRNKYIRRFGILGIEQAERNIDLYENKINDLYEELQYKYLELEKLSELALLSDMD